MDGWASRLCALLVMLAISACDGSNTATESDRTAVAARPFTSAGMLAKTSVDLRVMQATSAVPQVINPAEEEIRKTFGSSDHLMIPFQTVILIEELPENAAGRVMPFELIDGSE